MVWDGKTERRSTSSSDHDTLTRLVEILSTHVENFKTHTEDDKANFKILNRNMYIAIGFVVAIQVMPTIGALVKMFTKGG